MSITEIVLLIAGAVVFVLSFLLPAKKEETSKETRELVKEEVKTLVSTEFDSVKGHMNEVVDEAVGYAMEKTERSLERLSNEKIMAVNEYSDTVLKEIHKNHEEVMFLYDMLNDKHINLKNTVTEVNKAVKEAEATAKEAEAVMSTFQKLTPESVALAEESIAESAASEEVVEKITTEGMTAKKAATGTAAAMTKRSVHKSDEKLAGSKLQDGMDISFMPQSEEEGGNSNERILKLYRQGKSKVAIAKELGLGVGEVKLVIDLYKSL